MSQSRPGPDRRVAKRDIRLWRVVGKQEVSYSEEDHQHGGHMLKLTLIQGEAPQVATI